MILIGRIPRYCIGLMLGAALILTASTVARAIRTDVGNDFIETQSTSGCDAAKINCSFTFAAIPASTERLVLKASCEFKLADKDAKVWSSTLGQRSGSTTAAPFSTLVPVSVSASATFHFVSILADIYHPFASGQTPQIFVRITGGSLSAASCSISGVSKNVIP
jgi:hypothetical protein